MGEGIIALLSLLLGAFLMDRYRSKEPRLVRDSEIDKETADRLEAANRDDDERRTDTEEAARLVDSLSDTELAGEFDRLFGAVPDVSSDDGGSDRPVRRDPGSD